MADSTPELWKLLAWNGISLRVPPHWEVSSLATSYLQLDDGDGPVLELKWQQLKGSFSHKSHMRKLARFSGAGSGVNFQQRSLPERWRQLLQGFEAQSFEWHGQEIGGEGVILYCTMCQKATLLQFYQRMGVNDPLVTLQVLNSFRDHSEDGWVTWSLYGLRALMPHRFVLVSHSFHPGHYQLAFQHGHEHVTLSRWGPADILLKEGDLLDWFENRCREFRWCMTSSFRKHNFRGNPAIGGQSRRSNGPGARLWAQVTRKLPHIWIRIWHIPTSNQILGVTARGLKPLDEKTLEEICSNYEVV